MGQCSGSMGRKRIFIVDDHPLMREGLGQLIARQPTLEVCGEAGTALEALEKIVSRNPDLVLTDLTLPDKNGLELIKDVKALLPRMLVLVISMHDEALYAERAMRAGARSYIMKREATDKVLDAIKSVLEGKTYFSNAVNATMAQKLARGATNIPDSPVADLSDRELEVFDLLGRGCNTRQISDQLNLSFKTVQVYCARIKEKLNLANINELITHAVRWHESQHVK